MGDAPTQVDIYRILGKLGEGGMGTVYEAAPNDDTAHVAIKILHAEHARSEEFLARFFNEARAVRDVEHRGLVQVSTAGKLPDGTAYIVMELLAGESLAVRLKRSGGALPVVDVIRLGALIADSLAAAHEKGIVHRDLKPENIMVVPDASLAAGERTKLLDFGIAKLADGQDFVKTRTNAMLGTPIYMSPEQCRGAGKVDDRADVYSFGVLLFAMVAGRPPFTGEGMGDIMGKHMYEAPPALEDVAPEVPAPLADLVATLLSKDKLQRPPMREVVIALTAMAAELPRLPKKAPRAAVPVLAPTPLVSGGATLGTLAGQKTESTRPQAPLKRLGVMLMVGLALSMSAAVAISRLSHHPTVAPAVIPPPPVMPLAATPPPPRKVRWKLDSQPPGASITRESDGQLVCQTPCWHEQLPSSGLIRLRVGREGYLDRYVDLAQDSDAERNEQLEPVRRTGKNKKLPLPGKPVVVAVPTATPTVEAPPPSTPKPTIHARPKIED